MWSANLMGCYSVLVMAVNQRPAVSSFQHLEIVSRARVLRSEAKEYLLKSKPFCIKGGGLTFRENYFKSQELAKARKFGVEQSKREAKPVSAAGSESQNQSQHQPLRS